MNKIGIITQARTGSKRLPCKIFKEINGKNLLQYHTDRLKLCRSSDNIFIATSSLEQDNCIEQFCNENNLTCFRGSEEDVLDRYYQCAKKYKLDIIVRVTSDCPLIDPYLLDKCVYSFFNQDWSEHEAGYLGTTHPHPYNELRYPDGTDVEIFTFACLKSAWHNATNHGDEKHKGNEREHVTTYIYENFENASFPADKDFSSYKYSVDTVDDFSLISTIINELSNQNQFGTYEEVVEIIDGHIKI